MIQPNELRIGNLVNIGVNVAEIKGIHTQTIGVDDNRSVHFYVKGYPNKNVNYHAVYSHDISPIPLSEDWLKRFGFREQKIRGDVWCWRTDHFALSFHSVKDRDLYLYGYRIGSGPVKYVHQLQNLYHSLTGEELTLSE